MSAESLFRFPARIMRTVLISLSRARINAASGPSPKGLWICGRIARIMTLSHQRSKAAGDFLSSGTASAYSVLSRYAQTASNPSCAASARSAMSSVLQAASERSRKFRSLPVRWARTAVLMSAVTTVSSA